LSQIDRFCIDRPAPLNLADGTISRGPARRRLRRA